MTSRLSLLIGLFLAAQALPAEESALAWDTQLVAASPEPGQRVVHASFGFRNASASTVSIIPRVSRSG